MAKSKRRAGQNIRNLAAKRRIKAMNHFLGAGAFLAIPLLLTKLGDIFLKPLSSLHPGQTKSVSFFFPQTAVLIDWDRLYELLDKDFV
jgi:hypothetical protein